MDICKVLQLDKCVLAPMAGYTDRAMRIMCREQGAGLLISEMVSARGIYYKDKKTAALTDFGKNEHPFAIQIFCNEPEIMAYAAEYCEALGADAVDINMGCPMPKIVGNGDGSALMKDHITAGKCVKAAAKRVKIPITVKMRLGWSEAEKSAPELARICEQSGAAAVTVHGRTREGLYFSEIDYETIAEVVRSVKIPVIGNGNISDRKSAERMKSTGCAGLMIGRAAVGNPFVFRTVNDGYCPTVNDKITAALRHFELMCEFKGEALAAREIRPHLAAYLKGIKGSHSYKSKIYSTTDKLEIISLIKEAGGQI